MGRPVGSGVVSAEERFWRFVNPIMDDRGCWEWSGALTSGKFNYGKMGLGYKEGWVAASRFSWVMHFGGIPEWACVLHKCDNPPCVNPSHLFLGSKRDNSVDMYEKGRHRGSTVTHCRRGHSRAEHGRAITCTRANGKRYDTWDCKICDKWRKERRRDGNPT